MSRQEDIGELATGSSTPLPVINWASIHKQAPEVVDVGARKATDPLPKVDVVVVTWTTAEWNAMDHVFLNSSTPRTLGADSWKTSWLPYERNTAGFASGDGGTLWGAFRVVQIGTLKVLLFKSNAHLAHPPWIKGLRAMIDQVLTDAAPTYLYSIGTAGAGQLNQDLGDAIITNAGTLQATISDNKNDPANGQMFKCENWFPPTTLMTGAQTLMFKLNTVATGAELQSIFAKVAAKHPPGNITLDDILNTPMTNTATPTVHIAKDVPLNTSDDYGMAPGAGSPTFCAYEEDDAVLGQEALKHNVKFAFIRNVSDTVVPETSHGKTISKAFRDAWAGAVYDAFGFYSAFNGAFATWAAIAG
jgi:hypothetical protein